MKKIYLFFMMIILSASLFGENRMPLACTGSTTHKNPSCNGLCDGTATVTPTGGSGTYTYSWTPAPGGGQGTATATGLCAGTYTVIVNDGAGCTFMVQATLTQPTAIFLTQTHINTKCDGQNNGSAKIFPTGGTPPYKYSWSTTPVQTTQTATGLGAGTYTVMVTDSNGCSKTDIVIISGPLFPLKATVVQTNVRCHGGSGGSARVSATGGMTPYTYSWSTTPVVKTQSVTGLSAGTYTITVTDANGCSYSDVITITEPTAITATVNTTDAACNQANGTATVTATGGTGILNYSWNTMPPQFNAKASNLAAGTYTCTITDSNGCTTTIIAIIKNANGLLATIAGTTNVSCNGGGNGAATVSVKGGTAPYTYSWLPSGGNGTTATNLTAGTYTIEVSDANGCKSSAVATIKQPDSLSVSLNLTNVTCYGSSTGTVKVTVKGGTPPYSYSWNTSPVQTTASLTGLAAGNYTVKITDAAGCTVSRTVIITQPSSALVVNVNSGPVSCAGGNNGSATANVSGGIMPYAFSWSTTPPQTTQTATNLTAGTYTITVKDSSKCISWTTVTITQPAPINAKVVTTNASCSTANGSAKVTASGGTGPLSYSWNSSPPSLTATDSGLVAGIYMVTIADSVGCTKNVTAVINNTGGPQTTISGTEVSCNGGMNGTASVKVTGGTPPYQYSWSPSGGTAGIASNLVAGTYTVKVTDTTGCSSSATIIITQPTAITDKITHTNVTCYKATTGTAHVTATGGTPAYSYSWSTMPAQTSPNVIGLAAGIYTISITDADGCIAIDSVKITQPDSALQLIVSSSNITCHGGKNGVAHGTALGGVPPYHFVWSTVPPQTSSTATGLGGGIYTLTLTDTSGCTQTQTVTITDPAAITASINTTNAGCGLSNGSATVTANGGTGGYTYSWDSNPTQNTAMASNLSAGIYSVFVKDANGCTSSAICSINNTGGPTTFINGTNVSCNGGSNGTATVNPTGGTTPYTYSWSPAGGTGTTATGLSAGIYTCTITDAGGCVTEVSRNVTQPAALMDSISSIQNVSCNGNSSGMITIATWGGSPAYSYSWNTTPVQSTSTAKGLPAGTYTATITDAHGCTLQVSATITQPAAPLTCTTVHSNPSCSGGNNGAASASPAGGVAPYTYSWTSIPSQNTQTAVNLTDGAYTVFVSDANTCQTSNSISLTSPPPIIASATTKEAACGAANGLAMVKASGGTGALTYSWSNGQTSDTLTGLVAGVYSVSITDANGCMKTLSATVGNSGGPILTVSGNNISCHGGMNGSASVSPSGGKAPYTYSWSTTPPQTTAVATGLSEGTYTVAVNDSAGCVANSLVTLTAPVALDTKSTGTNPSCAVCPDGKATANVTGGTPAYTYSWDNGQTSATATGLIAGTYTCIITDANGCQSSTDVTLTFSTGTGNMVVENSYKVYPNPASGSLIVELQTSQTYRFTISINNVLGQELFSAFREANGSYKEVIDLTNIPEGLYFITLQTGTERLIKKVIIQ